MKLNWTHKAGLFLTLVAVGFGPFLELSAKQAVRIALFGIAFAWLIGNVSPRTLAVTFAILICGVGLYVAVAPVWSDWNSVRNSAAQYDLAIADLRAELKPEWDEGSFRPIVVGSPIPPGATIGEPQNGAKPKKQGQHSDADIAPTRVVTVPDSARNWIRPENWGSLGDWFSRHASGGPTVSFPQTMSDAEIMKAFQRDLLLPRPRFSLGSSVRTHSWNVICCLALFVSGLSFLGWLFRGRSRASDRKLVCVN